MGAGVADQGGLHMEQILMMTTTEDMTLMMTMAMACHLQEDP